MSDPVDPKEVMREIRASVRGSANVNAGGNPDDDLAFIIENADTDFAREINTHRGGLGKLYLRFRKWIYREHRLSAGPVIEKQIQINRALGRMLASQQERLSQLEERTAKFESNSRGESGNRSE